MLQPNLSQLLSNDHLVVKYGDDGCTSGNADTRKGAEGNPFTFSPQLIHLNKDHEFFEDGDICRHMYLQDLYMSEADDKKGLSVSEFACHITGCCAVFNTLEEFEHHYNSLHRHVCCSCRRSFPTAHLLDIHIQEWHDSLFTILAEKQDMYKCLVEVCGQKFRTSEHRKDHLINVHKYPADFRFDRRKKDKGAAGQRRQQQRNTAMEVVQDVCVSEGVCEVMCDVPSNDPQHEESMETHVVAEEATGDTKSGSLEEDTDFSDAGHGNADTSTAPPKPRFSYRVPPNVCFGHSSVRGFKGRRGKRK
ncbi:zinc finger protein 511 [Takifugu flavidus]|nr:zinc finger protein 511 [Takifugu flavidus]